MTAPSQRHRTWDNVAAITDLPNVNASPTQDPSLLVGDTCYVTGESRAYVCTTSTPGAAQWVSLGPAETLVFGISDLSGLSTGLPSAMIPGGPSGPPVIGSARPIIARRAGKLSRLAVWQTQPASFSGLIYYTVTKNSASTPLSVPLNDSTQVNFDNGNVVDVADGDLIGMIVYAATLPTSTTTVVIASVLFS